MLHIPPTNSLFLTAKQELCKKAYLSTKNIEEFSGKKFRRKGQQTEKDMTERVTDRTSQKNKGDNCAESQSSPTTTGYVTRRVVGFIAVSYTHLTLPTRRTV